MGRFKPTIGTLSLAAFNWAVVCYLLAAWLNNSRWLWTALIMTAVGVAYGIAWTFKKTGIGEPMARPDDIQHDDEAMYWKQRYEQMRQALGDEVHKGR